MPLEGSLWPFLDEHAPKLIAEYFESFGGRWFDALGGGGDAVGSRNAITSEDLVSLAFLSVPIDGDSVMPLLDVRAAEITQLLSDIPSDVPLCTEQGREHIEAGSPAWRLYEIVRSVPEMGWVRSNKLLARKRPQLLPVYDNVVKNALQPNSDAFWLPLWETLQDDGLIRRLEEIRTDAAELCAETTIIDVSSISLLRVLDVAVWMRNQGIKESKHASHVKPIPFTPRRG